MKSVAPSLRAKPAFSAYSKHAPSERCIVRANHTKRAFSKTVGNTAAPHHTRRELLSQSTAAFLIANLLSVPSASANSLQDVARQLTRPSDITPVQAAVALLDARSTLRDMAPLVESAPDSKERFDGRKLWPAYAKWLRPVGPSAPVAASIIAGTDAEATLSAEYGGTGGSNAAVDAVYIALGKVLTISGRTIKDEAQVDVQLIKDAEVAIDGVIAQLPKELVDEAQQFRIARAAGKA